VTSTGGRFSPGAKGRLTLRDLDRFPGQSLFDRIGRTVCRAGCLPRKELYEAWEVARRVRRLCRGGRVVDVGGGHGLLAQLMLLLDDTSPNALVVDPSIPPSSARLQQVMHEEWPRLKGRLEFITMPLENLGEPRPDSGPLPLHSTDVVVSSHACGSLTDRVLAAAATVRARVAVLPCCHDFEACDDGGLAGWVDRALAIDIARAAQLRQRGYRIRTQTIPEAITPRHRLLIGIPVG
jgi:SAM-dependent methyltransferase